MRVKTWTIVSNKGTNTLVVREDKHISHPKYHKRYLASKKFYVHVEDSSKYEEWTTITIQESAPISKLKRWVPVVDSK